MWLFRFKTWGSSVPFVNKSERDQGFHVTHRWNFSPLFLDFFFHFILSISSSSFIRVDVNRFYTRLYFLQLGDEEKVIQIPELLGSYLLLRYFDLRRKTANSPFLLFDFCASLAFHSLFPIRHLRLSYRAIDSRLDTLSMAELGILTRIPSAGSRECTAEESLLAMHDCTSQAGFAGR
jgi:hypothetical protein